MLVATIATTATYKWLSSESRSSANRMLQEEARQSAVAGLTAAQAWMAFHGNETGAIIRQFLVQSDKGAPIKFGDSLKALSKPGQEFNVWMVGADTNTHPYTIKLASQGESRNGTKYTEIGIMKVSGLYRVQIPQNESGISFNQAFAGEHAGITAVDYLESGLVTGDFTNNAPVIGSKMVITGSASYQSTTTQNGDLYVNGNFEATGNITFGNSGSIDTLVAYINGDVTCADGNTFEVYGDLFINGSIKSCTQIIVHGNMTVNGTIDVSDNNKAHVKLEVDKDLVFTETGKLEYPSGNQYSTIDVKGNLYLTNDIVSHCTAESANCGDAGGKRSITVGKKFFQYGSANYAVLKQTSASDAAYGIFREGTSSDDIHGDENARSNSRIVTLNTSSVDNVTINGWVRTDAALKQANSRYWEKIDKMKAYQKLIVGDGENAYIPQPILVNNEEYWKPARANEFCDTKADNGAGKIASGTFKMTNDMVKKLNECYVAADAADKLYNGFLVINWEYDQVDQPTEYLDHHFIFFAEKKFGDQAYLPGTTENGIVFLYLGAGAGAVFGPDEKFHNYLIYSADDIAEINRLRISGSMVMANGKKLKKTQGMTGLKFKESVVSTIASAGVIIDNPEYVKLADPDKSTTPGVSNNKRSDGYHIATAPQLLIDIESQYKNEEIDESKLEDNPILPSVIVLPRILYLPVDPEGKLSDYYRIYNLNGAKDVFKDNNSTCSPSTGIHTTGKFSDNSGKMKEGIYTCSYASKEYGDLPFYVVVKGTMGGDPYVTFEKSAQEISTSVVAQVNLKVTESSHAENSSVDVRVTKVPYGWTLTPAAGVAVLKQTEADGVAVYTVTFTPTSETITAFTVTMGDGGAANGDIMFQLVEPCDGCRIGSPDTHTITATGSFTIERHSIKEYCNVDGNEAYCKSNGYDDIIKAIEDNAVCDNLIGSNLSWVFPEGGTNCAIKDDKYNDEWECSIYITNDITLQKQAAANHAGCEVTIPGENNFIATASSDDVKPLYASFTRKRLPLRLKLENANGGSKINVTYATYETATEGEASTLQSYDENTTIHVYAGYKYFFTVEALGGDVFKAWSCKGSDCTTKGAAAIAEYQMVPMRANDTLTAIFNKEDTHCFYEDFNDHNEDAYKGGNESFLSGGFCDSTNTRCVDFCENKPQQGRSCDISNSRYYSTKKPDWVMVYDNADVDDDCNYDWDAHTECNDSPKMEVTVERTGFLYWGTKVKKTYYQSPLGCHKLYCSETKKDGNPQGPLVQGVRTDKYIRTSFITGTKLNRTANHKNGNQGVILNTKIAGQNGTMTSLFNTGVLSVFKGENFWRGLVDGFISGDWTGILPESRFDYENSGFVFRSNSDGSEYFSLSFFGIDLVNVAIDLTPDKLTSNSKEIYARLCRVTGQTATVGQTPCQTKQLDLNELIKLGLLINGFTVASPLTATIQVDGSEISIGLTIEKKAFSDKQKFVTFDLNKEPFNGVTYDDNNHQYVGLKLSNPGFKVHDISWQSQTFASDCWANPKIICSFRSRYSGAMVPQNEYVEPWVTFSSFAPSDYDGCKVKYYYNGCDNATTPDKWALSEDTKEDFWQQLYKHYSCDDKHRTGNFWDKGSPLNNNGKQYFFETKGKHGYEFSDGKVFGYAKDAKVILDCDNSSTVAPSSLLAEQSCGEFYVGQIIPCENNYNFLNGSTVECQGRCGVKSPAGDNGANLREAAVKLKVSNPTGTPITVYLKDLAGVMSEGQTFDKDGEISIEVTDLADALGFNPQEVDSVIFETDDAHKDYLFTIQDLQGSCPYALGLDACTIKYNNSSWIINAPATNASECIVNVDPNSKAKAENDGACSNTYQLKETDLLSKNEEMTFNFSVTAIRKNADGDEVERVTQDCPAYTVKPVEIECSIEQSVVNQGEGVPSMKYSFENCPEGGCSYTISLAGKSYSTKGTGGTQQFGSLNSIANPMSEGAYYYTIISHGNEKTCGFSVRKVNTKATASNCQYDKDTKIFSADISYGGSNWFGSLSRLDNIAYVFNLANYHDDERTHIEEDLSEAVKNFRIGDKIKLTLNANMNDSEGCMVAYEPPTDESGSGQGAETPTAELAVTCPKDLIRADGWGSFEFTPVSVTGCNDGCSVKITSAEGVALIDNEGSDYTSAYSLNPVDYDMAKSGKNVQYTFTLQNSSSAKSCDFNVFFAKIPEVSCGNTQYAQAGTEQTFQFTSLSNCASPARCEYKIEGEDATPSVWTAVSGSSPSMKGKVPSTTSLVDQTTEFELFVQNADLLAVRSCKTTVKYFNSSGTLKIGTSGVNVTNGKNEKTEKCYLVPIPTNAKTFQCYADKACEFNNKLGTFNGKEIKYSLTDRYSDQIELIDGDKYGKLCINANARPYNWVFGNVYHDVYCKFTTY